MTDGTRGYVQSQLANVFGLRSKGPSTQIAKFLGEFAPKSLSTLEKKGYARIQLPSGQVGNFFPAGIVSTLAMGVIDAALNGTLHPKRKHTLFARCTRPTPPKPYGRRHRPRARAERSEMQKSPEET